MPDTAVIPIVRVAVLAATDDGGRLTEMALPAELPLREILPAVQRLVRPSNDDEADAPEPLSLAPIGGAPFSLDATLDTVGVVDGDLLALQPVPAGPPAPRIVEDIADAAVIFSAAREKPWGIDHIQRAATIAVVALILVATALAVAHRVITGEALGLFTVSGVAVATVVGALLSRIRSPRLATALAVIALAPVAAALALAVPGDSAAPKVLLAAAGVTAWSIISITLGDRGISVFTATAVAGFGVLLAAAAETVWELPIVALGCGLVLLALLVTVQAAQLSAACRPLPVARDSRAGRPDTVGAAAAGARGSAPPGEDQRLPPDRLHRGRCASRPYRFARTRRTVGGIALGVVRGGRRRGGCDAAGPRVGFRALQGMAAEPLVPVDGRAVGDVRRDGPVRRGVVGVGCACRAGAGVGRRRAESAHRRTGELLAADAASGRFRRGRRRRIADPGDGVSGRTVHVGTRIR